MHVLYEKGNQTTPMKTAYLDTETTGLHPNRGDRVVEVAVIDDDGRALIDELVDPGRSVPAQVTAIHGITDAMVHGAPTLAQLMPRIRKACRHRRVVIYNADFDTRFLPEVEEQAAQVACCMLRFARCYGEWNAYRGGYRWQRLAVAAQHVGHVWQGDAHRALADTLACRTVWRWLESQEDGGT